MNILFLHQNFPGQFLHLAPALARLGHRVVALARRDNGALPGIQSYRYGSEETAPTTHPWSRDFVSKTVVGEQCANAALALRAKGFEPDLIVSHPGWGESMFMRDVFPGARQRIYAEFFYANTGLDTGFDPEFGPASGRADWRTGAHIRARNAAQLVSLEQMDAAISPTAWQRSTYPPAFRDRIDIAFDGVDTDSVRPDPGASFETNGTVFRAGEPVVTFVARNLEPYRGYHVFMRSLPDILRRNPQARVLIVGGDGCSYGLPPRGGATYKEMFFDEVKNDLDMQRVFFLGRVPYASFVKILQVSACHVYLTYPFVLSWSLIEAMAGGCAIVASATGPVFDAIEHGKNGVLVDFFDRRAISDTVTEMLRRPHGFERLRRAARTTAENRFDLNRICLQRQIDLALAT